MCMQHGGSSLRIEVKVSSYLTSIINFLQVQEVESKTLYCRYVQTHMLGPNIVIERENKSDAWSLIKLNEQYNFKTQQSRP